MFTAVQGSARAARALSLVGLVFVGVSASAHADSGSPAADDIAVSVFLGAGVGPEFEGSEDYTALALFGGRAQYENYYAELSGLSLRANVLNSAQFNLGPVVRYSLGRDDDIENDRVERLGEIDDAFEGGFFARMNFRPNNTTRHRAGIEAEFLHDLSDTHDGWLLTLKADYSMPLAERIDLGFNVSTTYASDDYMQTYFGVSAAGSAASGLRRFDAESGFKDVSFGIRPSYTFNENWGVFGVLRYSELVGDAADSPIVDDDGNSSQFFAGFGVSYRF